MGKRLHCGLSGRGAIETGGRRPFATLVVLVAAPACLPVVPASAPPPDSPAQVCAFPLPALRGPYATVGEVLEHLGTSEWDLLEFVSVYEVGSTARGRLRDGLFPRE